MTRSPTLAVGLAVLGLVLATPAVALACPACLGAIDAKSQQGYFIGFVMMTLLPFATIGPLVWWLVKRSRAGQ